MTTAFLVMIISTVFFILYARLCIVETNRGKRFFAPYIRRVADNAMDALLRSIERRAVYVGRYIITLSWYYSLHTFLRLTLQFLASIYYALEKLLHSNRDKARMIRRERKQAERSHLTVLAEHKVETELTPHQKEKRKAKALAGK
jgi:hypothetical protein